MIVLNPMIKAQPDWDGTSRTVGVVMEYWLATRYKDFLKAELDRKLPHVKAAIDFVTFLDDCFATTSLNGGNLKTQCLADPHTCAVSCVNTATSAQFQNWFGEIVARRGLSSSPKEEEDSSREKHALLTRKLNNEKSLKEYQFKKNALQESERKRKLAEVVYSECKEAPTACECKRIGEVGDFTCWWNGGRTMRQDDGRRSFMVPPNSCYSKKTEDIRFNWVSIWVLLCKLRYITK